MDGRIKDYYFDEINNINDFDDLFENEQEAMYQPIMNKKAAKAAEKDLKEEFIEEDETITNVNDELI